MTNFKLYPKQKEKADVIAKAFWHQDFILLTGEVGVGKTYMASYIVKKWQDEHTDAKFLIIVPKHVHNKWIEVLTSAGVNMNDVTIVNTFKKEDIDKADFVVYDEIHEIKTKVKHFENYVKTDKKVLGLTGSIVDKSVKDITNITNYFSNGGKKYPMKKDMINMKTDEKYVRFIVAPLLTVGLSKDDVIETVTTMDDKIIVNTENYSIDMDKEESAFYNFVTSRMSKLEISQTQKMRYLNGFLDRVPSMTEFVQKTNRTDGETWTRTYFIGEKLHKKNPMKDKIVNELLNKDEYSKKTLIYTFDNEVAKRIAKATNAEFVDTSDQFNAEKLINEKLEHSAVVINILNILTGVDLHADTIIWYQTPVSLTQDVQGTGRITRLSSSTNEKTVIYLYHKNTMQEKQVNQLIENYKINNELIQKEDQTAQTEKKKYFPFGLK